MLTAKMGLGSREVGMGGAEGSLLFGRQGRVSSLAKLNASHKKRILRFARNMFSGTIGLKAKVLAFAGLHSSSTEGSVSNPLLSDIAGKWLSA